MTRNVRYIGFVAVSVVALAVVAQSVLGDASSGTAIPTLAARIHHQTEATRAALELANDPWIPRVVGLGFGLAVGLVAGGVGAYAKRGETR